MAKRSLASLALMLVLLSSQLQATLQACAPVPRNGQFVSIFEEAAVIVWNAGTHTEHFIRTASFNSTEDFGFLVPTPTKPELAEARDALSTLSHIVAPKSITQREFNGFDFTPLIFAFGERETATSSAPMASRVMVLDEQQVGGYDAVVLEADNAQALNGWLAQHGYSSRPALVEWLEPYVKAHWKITAFKIAAKRNRFATSPVRMSFNTERPFFPYREPADLRTEKSLQSLHRTLKVFFLSDNRVQGSLASRDWPGKTTWANRIEEPFYQSIAADCGLTAQQLPANLWLTKFEDDASPRPGTDDVFFSAASMQSPITPPPIIIGDRWKFPLPLDVIFLLGIALIVIWRIRKKKTRPS